MALIDHRSVCPSGHTGEGREGRIILVGRRSRTALPCSQRCGSIAIADVPEPQERAEPSVCGVSSPECDGKLRGYDLYQLHAVKAAAKHCDPASLFGDCTSGVGGSAAAQPSLLVAASTASVATKLWPFGSLAPPSRWPSPICYLLFAICYRRPSLRRGRALCLSILEPYFNLSG